MTTQPLAELPALLPLTEAARAVLLAARQELTRLPFRVGRDLRAPNRRRTRWFGERRRGSAGPNDLYLAETARPYRVSRLHFLIGFDPDTTRFFIEDRGSTCGTLVGKERLGGDRLGGRRVLQHGDVIRPGGDHSPYAFRFLLATPAGGSNDDDMATPSVAKWRDRA